MLISKLLAAAGESVPSEFVETITSTRGLGSLAGLVIIVLAGHFFRRRSADQDLLAHEATKQKLVDKLGDLAIEVLRRHPSDKKKDDAP